MLSLNYISWSLCFFSMFRFSKIYLKHLIWKTLILYYNLCKRSQVVTRYALIGLSLILSYLKLYEAHYLSNFDLSSATKLFCILQYSLCFQKCVACHLKTVRKNLNLVIKVVFSSKDKFMFNSFVSLISYRCSCPR